MLQALNRELRWAVHLGVPAVYTSLKGMQCANFASILNMYMQSTQRTQVRSLGSHPMASFASALVIELTALCPPTLFVLLATVLDWRTHGGAYCLGGLGERGASVASPLFFFPCIKLAVPCAVP